VKSKIMPQSAETCGLLRLARWVCHLACSASFIALLSSGTALAAAEELALFKSTSGAAICDDANGFAAMFEGRRTFLWRPEWLKMIKQSETAKSAIIVPLLVEAEAALKLAPLLVVDKTKTPASGDKHDYYSMAPYWWPTVGKPNGEPYVRIDGKVNPERDGTGFDARRLSKLSNALTTLSLAHYYTGDQRFASHAALLIRAWFLDPATRMNPNFSYAQAVPGVSNGRPEGVIDAQKLMPIIESIGLLAPSGALSPAEQQALEAWFAKLAVWMATSDNGKAERAKTNNHGIYFDLMLTHFALFARMEDVPEQVIRSFPARRIAVQFAPDGSLPEELSRTRSWHYTHWTILATSQMAGLGECVGLDLWNFKTADGRGLRTSLNWVAQFAGNEGKWKYPETAFEKGGKLSAARHVAFENLRTAAWGLQDPAFERAARIYADAEPSAEVHRWLLPYVSK
jgi:hypothetical protein